MLSLVDPVSYEVPATSGLPLGIDIIETFALPSHRATHDGARSGNSRLRFGSMRPKHYRRKKRSDCKRGSFRRRISRDDDRFCAANCPGGSVTAPKGRNPKAQGNALGWETGQEIQKVQRTVTNRRGQFRFARPRYGPLGLESSWAPIRSPGRCPGLSSWTPSGPAISSPAREMFPLAAPCRGG